MNDGAPELDPLVGVVLDKDYQVLRRIGIGGMSIVYLVEHTRLRKQFAAKLLHLELAANPEALARFETEAKAASQLEHENIVRVTDYGISVDGRPYIIMELLRGRTLDEHLVESPLTLQEAVLVIVSVCRGLAVAHADGIVHRDIKPDNIYLTQKSSNQFGVKLLDFGIAKAPLATGKLTKHGQTIGSPHYMAPEACRGEEVDHRADIYSVGVLMYLLFTGALPHHDENFLKLLQRHVLDPVTPPSQHVPTISPQLEQVIMHAIEKDRDDRYLSVEHLLGEFELALPEGSNQLLLAGSRVSTPIPTITPTSLPAVRPTPLPRAATPVPRPAHTSTPPLAAQPPVMPSMPPASRRSPLIIVALLVALVAASAGIFALVSARMKDTKVADAKQDAAVVALRATDAPTPRRVGSASSIDEAPPTIAKVKLKITTKPTRAKIKLNGIDLGRTPIDTDIAPVDTGTLEITADGYDSETRTMPLVTDQTLEIALSKPKQTGQKPPQRDHTPVRPRTGSNSTPPPTGSNGDLDIRMHR